MKQDKISVIVPCYNVEKYVAKCLDSLINQTYKNLEILVVEDCATDKTLDIFDLGKDSLNYYYNNLRNAKKALKNYLTIVDTFTKIVSDNKIGINIIFRNRHALSNFKKFRNFNSII